MAENKVICDTDVIIDYWDMNKPRHAATKAILNGSIGIDNVVISAITKMELIVGAVNKNDLKKISTNIDRLIVAFIDPEITLTAFTLLKKYSLSHGLALADGLIAATAIVSKTELFTYNTKDYKFITELKLYKH
jgi:predicted nucleic acid-binding protein